MPDGDRPLWALHEQLGRKRRDERFPGKEKAGVQSGIGIGDFRAGCAEVLNSKSEARNPKQTPNSNDRNPKEHLTENGFIFFFDIRILEFEFVSSFGFRHSNLIE